jgi:chaperonin GroES
MNMATKVKPLGDRILVKRQEAATRTESGLYLPESAAEKPQQAQVIAVGEGRISEKTGNRVAPSVKKGDTIILNQWGGTAIKIDNDELLIINEDDILATVG